MKKKNIALISLVILLILITFTSCTTNNNGGVKVDISVDSASTKFDTTYLTTDSTITFRITLNQPITSTGTAKLKILPYDLQNSSEFTLNAERIDSFNYIAYFNTSLPGLYSFKGIFNQIGSNNPFESEEFIKEIALSRNDSEGNDNYPEILSMNLQASSNNQKPPLIINDNSEYDLKAVMGLGITPTLGLEIDSKNLNSLKVVISGAGSVLPEVQINNPDDLNLPINFNFPSEGTYDFYIMLYDGNSSNTLNIYDTKKIQLIVTNDTVSPKLLDPQESITGTNELNYNSYADFYYKNIHIKDDGIGIYKVTITVSQGKTYNEKYEYIYENGLKDFSDTIPLPIDQSNLSINAEDLAGNTSNSSFSVKVSNVEAEANLEITDLNGNVLKNNSELEYEERKVNIRASISPSSEATDLNFNFKVNNDSEWVEYYSNNEIIYNENLNQDFITIPNVILPEGENLLSLHIVDNNNNLKLNTSKTINVIDIKPPELYKIELVFNGQKHLIYSLDYERNSIEPVPENISISDIISLNPTMYIYFRDRSGIQNLGNIQANLTTPSAVVTREFEPDNASDVNGYSIRYSLSNIEDFIESGDYSISISGDQIVDSNGNELRDSQGSVRAYTGDFYISN
jgi:hypothetical protein